MSQIHDITDFSKAVLNLGAFLQEDFCGSGGGGIASFDHRKKN